MLDMLNKIFHSNILTGFRNRLYRFRLRWGNKITQSKAEVNSVIDSATTEQVNKYLEQSFPDYDLSNIQNKHVFAKRLVSEFVDTKNDPNEVLAGKATVSTQQQYSAGGVLPRQIYAGQQLFAHFDTLGKVPNNEQVFVRWSNQSTGEVLFFMPQLVRRLKRVEAGHDGVFLDNA